MKKDRLSKMKTKKLSTKVTLICIIPSTILLIVLCMLSIMVTKKVLVNNVKTSLRGQATAKCMNISNGIKGAIDAAVLPKREAEIKEAIKNNDTESIKDILNMIAGVSPLVGDAEFILTDENTIIRKDGSEKYQDPPEWYDEEKFSSKEPYFVTLSAVADRNTPIIKYVCPIMDKSGNASSGFVISMNNPRVLEMMKLSSSFQSQKWFVISKDINMLYYPRDYDTAVCDGIKKIIADENGMIDGVRTISNQENIIYVHGMDDIDGIKLCFVVPVNAVLKSSVPTIIIVILFAVISIGLIIYFVFFLTNNIVAEINGIRESLSGISKNEFSGGIEVKTQDEIGELVKDFNSAIDVLKYQAEHDSRTHFYTAEAFGKKSKNLLVTDTENTHAVIRVDIDNFSFVNDIFDWEVGNEILIKISNIIRAVFDGNSIHGYLGNDIFVVFFSYNDRDEMLTRIIKTVDSIKACESRIHIVPHIGICDNIKPDADMSIMCDYAGIALKTIKGNLLETYAVYDEKFDEKHTIQKFVESNKQRALENKNFYILLQPKCDINTGKVVGAEALVRWKNAETGEIISPGKFIPIFEKNGFIITLDRYVWEETCKVIKEWRDKGYRDIPISVNVSRMHIFNPGFARGFEELVKKYNIPPELLEVEITESALLENSESELERVMNDLRSRGFKLLMDDFASGYSSLIALQKLPFDVIKIDKALIDNINEPKNNKFVSGTVSFLKDLEKEIVIEGVEHDWQKEILKGTGSRIVQGYCFSRPIPVEDFEKMAFGDEIKENESKEIKA